MAPKDGQDEVSYLKQLLQQLSDKITELEGKAKSAVSSSSSASVKGARLILIGPPGAGA